ncbi:MAG: MFS transporter, partial [Chloroflexi bacterium]|nr:MFS transporter [Chloroflexota bacterium]
MTVVKPPCDEGVVRAAPDVAACAEGVGPWVLAATILGSSMAFIDGTVVNVALPILQADLNASVADAQWVVEAYALLLAALAVVGLGGIVYGLIESSTLGWTHPLVLGAVAVGAAGLIGFVAREAWARAPMMPLDLFRSSTFSGANLLTLLLYSALGGVLFFFPFNL